MKKTNRIKTPRDIQNKKHLRRKTKNLEKSFLSPKSFIRSRYSRAAKIVSVKEVVTKIESILLTSPGGVREPRSSESELIRRELSIRENVYCFDQTTQISYSPTMKAKGNARRKLKQV